MSHKKHSKGHKGHHTGPIHHSDMGMHVGGIGGKDPHAHSSHNAANSKHGMPEGCSPVGGYDGGDEEGSEGMGTTNCENC